MHFMRSACRTVLVRVIYFTSKPDMDLAQLAEVRAACLDLAPVAGLAQAVAARARESEDQVSVDPVLADRVLAVSDLESALVRDQDPVLNFVLEESRRPGRNAMVHRPGAWFCNSS